MHPRAAVSARATHYLGRNPIGNIKKKYKASYKNGKPNNVKNFRTEFENTIE